MVMVMLVMECWVVAGDGAGAAAGSAAATAQLGPDRSELCHAELMNVRQ